MISQPPEELKLIRPFVHRGNQMQKPDPVITYYCYYWAVRLALEKGLHTASAECTVFVSDLMAELEERKDLLKGNDLLEDDVAAHIHVENFALKVFNNGCKAVESGTVTAKTPDTLQAAAVFLELTKLFTEEPDIEILKKIKYAKFHAARILKAIKDGTNLNPSMRPPSPTAEEVQDEAFAKGFDSPPKDNMGTVPQIIPSPQPEALMAPLLDTSMGTGVSFNSAPPLPPPPPTSRDTDTTFSAQTLGAPPPLPTKQGLFSSASGLHQPELSGPLPLTIGSSDSFSENSHTNINHSPLSSPSAPSSLPNATGQQQSAPCMPQHQQHQQLSRSFIPFPAPQFSQGNPCTPPGPSAHHQQPYHQQPPSPPPPPPAAPRKQLSPEDIAKAQKYAKWAISALDYEDIDNAILQLKNGLATLGAL